MHGQATPVRFPPHAVHEDEEDDILAFSVTTEKFAPNKNSP
ncbi:hypothetical protein F442_14785 [Phytophthora nicotianae P10297]|uniref:Uncharacterized protein n=3 Tax=Phytophthora nicotianae TaxID=4792 RepID=W2PTQ3_PHYN3|nr:hypothetical protein PPTG_23682 [Phytophthora nicotianae INRA-310]ETI39487.1 hypothetical protein F443_14950 [Phytophthora nicotianae P1569]ETN04021.1 hypothetical protein PPTG_23682 [Phytophthora nicotianae INRA-310]ETP37418.1 hypothetical protein F442_14785 [Phytophthora nicotianae P10297]